MTDLNQSDFPYHVDAVVSNSHCLNFISSLLINEGSGRQKEFNLNLGFYKPVQKFKGELFALAESSACKVYLEKNEKNHRRFYPSRMSMRTADYSETLGGLVYVIPYNVTEKSEILRVYKVSRYGPMMGHGSVEIWRKADSLWVLSSTKGTWIS